MAIRIFLVDDHVLVRQGFRALLAGVPDFEVVGEAGNGREALRLIRSLAPQVVLMDVTMPELNGLCATAHALREWPQLKVIMVTMHVTQAYVIESLRAGAAGYLLKNCDAAELERAIHAVMRGENYLASAVSQYVVENLLHTEDGVPAGGQHILSVRQREVLQLIAEGLSTRAIAARLNRSVKTIETHRAQLMQRLEIYEVAGLTRYAVRIGLIDATF